jgi:VanZ family protein
VRDLANRIKRVDFELDSGTARLFHPAVPGKDLWFKYWLPIALWMGLIFAGSTDVLSTHRTSRIIGPLLRWLNPNLSDESIRNVQIVVRKGSHVAEYAVLALLFWRARRQPIKNDPRPWSWPEAAFAVCAAGVYAATDEFHQMFVASRGASVWDIGLDTLGAAGGVLVIWCWRRWREHW